MRIALINPPRVDGYPVVREERYEHKDIGSVYPPLGLLHLAAVLEKDGHEVMVLDANGLDLSADKTIARVKEFSPRFIYGRVAFDCQRQDLEVLSRARQAVNCPLAVRNKIIADVPGIKRSLLELGSMDYFLDGEPEVVLAELLRVLASAGDPAGVRGVSYLKDGRMVSSEAADYLPSLEALPRPAYHLLPSLKPYRTGIFCSGRFAMVQASRGCPYRCSFCAYTGVPHRGRTVADVVGELCWLVDEVGVREVLFFDDLLGVKPGYIGELSQAMLDQKLKLKWACCQRADLIKAEGLHLAVRAGMVELAVGIESGSRRVLNQTDKKIDLGRVRDISRWCREAGVLFYAMVVLGLPGETKGTIEETVDFIRDIEPFYTQYCFATPFPNTNIYKYYTENGFLLSDDWSKYTPLNHKPVVRTEELSATELAELRNWAYRRTMLRPGYLWRQIRWRDPMWNLRGAWKLGGRVWSMLMGKAVR